MNLIFFIHRGFTYIPETFTLVSTDRSLVIIAILVSLAGLYISSQYNRKTLEMTEAHNKKTIFPALTLITNFKTNGANLFYCGIKNSGVGPAIITKVEFYYKKKKFIDLDKFLVEKFKTYSISTITKGSKISTLYDREVLAINSEQNIYKMYYKNPMIVLQIQAILKETRIKVEYESVYGEALNLDKMVYKLNT